MHGHNCGLRFGLPTSPVDLANGYPSTLHQEYVTVYQNTASLERLNSYMHHPISDFKRIVTNIPQESAGNFRYRAVMKE